MVTPKVLQAQVTQSVTPGNAVALAEICKGAPLPPGLGNPMSLPPWKE